MKREQDGRGHRLQEPGLKHKFQERTMDFAQSMYSETQRLSQAVTVCGIALIFVQSAGNTWPWWWDVVFLWIATGWMIAIWSLNKTDPLEKYSTQERISRWAVGGLAILIRIGVLSIWTRIIGRGLLVIIFREDKWYNLVIVLVSFFLAITVIMAYLYFIECPLPSGSILSASTRYNTIILSFTPGLVIFINGLLASTNQSFSPLHSATKWSLHYDRIRPTVYFWLLLIVNIVFNGSAAIICMSSAVFFNRLCSVICASTQVIIMGASIWHLLSIADDFRLQSTWTLALSLGITFALGLAIAVHKGYKLHPLKPKDLQSTLRLVQRCFPEGVQMGTVASKNNLEFYYQYFARKYDRVEFDDEQKTRTLAEQLIISVFEELIEKRSTGRHLSRLYYLHYLDEVDFSLSRMAALHAQLRYSNKGALSKLMLKIVEKKLTKRIFRVQAEGDRSILNNLTFVNCPRDPSTIQQAVVTDSRDFKSPLEAFHTYKLMDSLFDHILNQVEYIKKFYSYLGNSIVYVNEIHEMSKVLLKKSRVCEETFNKVEAMSNEICMFHLLPYAMFVHHTQNNNRQMREIIRKFQSRMRSKQHLLVWNSSLWQGKDGEVVLETSLDGSTFGKITYSSRESRLLLIPKPNFPKDIVGQCLSELLPESLSKIHHQAMLSFIERLDKKYLGVRKERFVRALGTKVFNRVSVVSVFRADVINGLRVVSLIEEIKSQDIFMLADGTYRIEGVCRSLDNGNDKIVAKLYGKRLYSLSHDLDFVAKEFIGYQMYLSSSNIDFGSGKLLNKNVSSIKHINPRVSVTGGNFSQHKTTFQLVKSTLAQVSVVRKMDRNKATRQPIRMHIDFGHDLTINCTENDILMKRFEINLNSKRETTLLILFKASVFPKDKLKSYGALAQLPSYPYLDIPQSRPEKRLADIDEFSDKSTQGKQGGIYKRTAEKIASALFTMADREQRRDSMVIGRSQWSIMVKDKVSLKSSKFHRSEDLRTLAYKGISIEKISTSRNTKRELFGISTSLILFWLFILYCSVLEYNFLQQGMEKLVGLRSLTSSSFKMALGWFLSHMYLVQYVLIREGYQSSDKYKVNVPTLHFDPLNNYLKERLRNTEDYKSFAMQIYKLKKEYIELSWSFRYSPSLHGDISPNRQYEFNSIHGLISQQLNFMYNNLSRITFDHYLFQDNSVLIEQGSVMAGSNMISGIINRQTENYNGQRSLLTWVVVSSIAFEVIISILIFYLVTRIRNKILRVYQCFRSLDEVEIQFKKDRLEHLSESIMQTYSSKNFAACYLKNIETGITSKTSSKDNFSEKDKLNQQNVRQYISRVSGMKFVYKRFYYFGLGVLLISVILMLQLTETMLFTTMFLLVDRQNKLNRLTVTFRFYTRLNFMYERLQLQFYEACLLKANIMNFKPVEKAMAKFDTTLKDYYELFYYVKREYSEGLSADEKALFGNLNVIYKTCDYVDYNKFNISSVECKAISKSMLEKGMFSQFTWAGDAFKSLMDRLKAIPTTQASTSVSLLSDPDFSSLELIGNTLLYPQYTKFDEVFQTALIAYNRGIQDFLWRGIYIYSGVAVVFTLLTLSQFMLRIYSNMQACLYSLLVLPATSLNDNPNVKLAIKNVGAVLR